MVVANQAPLFRDAYSLCVWILGRLEGNPRPLARAICSNAIRLSESITLALKNRRREERLEELDERLVTLRLQVRLAVDTRALTQQQALFALEQADRIGRQLGGWLRSLDSR